MGNKSSLFPNKTPFLAAVRKKGSETTDYSNTCSVSYTGLCMTFVVQLQLACFTSPHLRPSTKGSRPPQGSWTYGWKPRHWST